MQFDGEGVLRSPERFAHERMRSVNLFAVLCLVLGMTVVMPSPASASGDKVVVYSVDATTGDTAWSCDPTFARSSNGPIQVSLADTAGNDTDGFSLYCNYSPDGVTPAKTYVTNTSYCEDYFGAHDANYDYYQEDSFNHCVIPADQPIQPQLDYTADYPDNSRVHFDAHHSTGPGTLNYSWDFGDGTSLADQSTPTVNHAYARLARSYRVKLTVGNDSSGTPQTVTESVRVSVVAPSNRLTTLVAASCTHPPITVGVPRTSGVRYMLGSDDVSGKHFYVWPGKSLSIQPASAPGVSLYREYGPYVVSNRLATAKCTRILTLKGGLYYRKGSKSRHIKHVFRVSFSYDHTKIYLTCYRDGRAHPIKNCTTVERGHKLYVYAHVRNTWALTYFYLYNKGVKIFWLGGFTNR